MTSPNPITVSVDCMGGDHGPRVTLAACRRFLSAHPDARLILVGRAEALAGFSDARAQVVVATEVVEMDDPLEVALRKNGIDFVTWSDWLRLDAHERSEGETRGKARHKEPSAEALMQAVRALRG